MAAINTQKKNVDSLIRANFEAARCEADEIAAFALLPNPDGWTYDG